MNEELLIVTDWNIDDLFDKNFWNRNIYGVTSENHYDNSINDFLNNIEQDFLDSVTYDMWEVYDGIPREIKKVLFDNNETIFSIWVMDLNDTELNIIKTLIEKKLYQHLYEKIIRTKSYKNLLEQKKQAYRDISIKVSDSLFLEFVNKTISEKFVSLSSPEYIAIGGNDDVTLNESLEKMIKEGYKIIHKLKLESNTKKNISIFLFENKKK